MTHDFPIDSFVSWKGLVWCLGFRDATEELKAMAFVDFDVLGVEGEPMDGSTSCNATV